MMKTDTTIHIANSMTPAISSQEPVPNEKSSSDLAYQGGSFTSLLKADPSNSASTYDGEYAVDTWNTLKVPPGVGDTNKTFPEKLEAGLKLGEKITSSFPSMVISFLVMCIQLFANLQKSQMDNVMNQLNLMLMDMKRQIDAMKAEQKSNFMKDMLTAGIETASAAVQLVGSCVSTVKLGAKITEQSTLNNRDTVGKSKLSIETKSESLDGKAATTSKAVENDALSSNGQKDIVGGVENVSDDVRAANVKRQGIDADSAIDSITADELARKTATIRSEVEFINARLQAVTAASGLMKAFSPLTQGILGSEATAHQIEAREAENAKEINNSFSRQYSEAASGMRDVIMKLLGLLQDIQGMDPNNALASSRKMA